MSIVLDPTTHVYSKGLVTYTSVSAVIRSVLPTDFSMVDPSVLENARLRGVFIDERFCSWLRGENPRIPAGTDRDWSDRLLMLIEWWKKTAKNLKVETQVTVTDEEHLIAGTMDLRVASLKNGTRNKWDLKVVSELQPSYALQLGAYGSMDETDEVGIIHVTKDRVRLVEYDAEQCRADWRTALSWYLTKKRLLGKKS